MLKNKILSEIFKCFKKLHNANICHSKAHFCQNINRKERKTIFLFRHGYSETFVKRS